MTQINYNADPLLHVEGLKQHFRISRTYTTKAVDGISFDRAENIKTDSFFAIFDSYFVDAEG